jgi:dihydroorotase|tara:strand:+ start:2911 stop:4245 length:1335 start_codon:yes stop_codon:yes gene_type:complete
LKNDTVIKNCKIVNEGIVKEADVLIRKGRIEKIASDIAAEGNIIDAAGLHLFPGVIDDQVHFREPGLTDRGNIKSESLAAIAGGTTTFMDMPNVLPPTLTNELWRQKIQIASSNASANYSFYMGSSNENIEEIRAIDSSEVCGVKVFMGASTGNLLVDNEESLNLIFRDSPVPIATHCEDTPMIKEAEENFKARYGENIPMEAHAEIRSREACLKSSQKAVDLANKYKQDLHILHISTADELSLFSTKPIEDKHITAEVCIPHLYFNSDDYQNKGSLIKCNPSIKLPSDQLALKDALKTGLIDFVATDHAPHVLAGKSNPYMDCPSGMPSIEQTLLVVLEMVKNGDLSLEDVPRVTSHNIAKRFNIKDRGFIREGYWADIVLVNLEDEHIIDDANTNYACGWTPFHGDSFSCKIIDTIVNGEHVFSRGKFLKTQQGLQIEFTRS